VSQTNDLLTTYQDARRHGAFISHKRNSEESRFYAPADAARSGNDDTISNDNDTTSSTTAHDDAPNPPNPITIPIATYSPAYHPGFIPDLSPHPSDSNHNPSSVPRGILALPVLSNNPLTAVVDEALSILEEVVPGIAFPADLRDSYQTESSSPAANNSTSDTNSTAPNPQSPRPRPFPDIIQRDLSLNDSPLSSIDSLLGPLHVGDLEALVESVVNDVSVVEESVGLPALGLPVSLKTRSPVEVEGISLSVSGFSVPFGPGPLLQRDQPLDGSPLSSIDSLLGPLQVGNLEGLIESVVNDVSVVEASVGFPAFGLPISLKGRSLIEVDGISLPIPDLLPVDAPAISVPEVSPSAAFAVPFGPGPALPPPVPQPPSILPALPNILGSIPITPTLSASLSDVLSVLLPPLPPLGPGPVLSSAAGLPLQVLPGLHLPSLPIPPLPIVPSLSSPPTSNPPSPSTTTSPSPSTVARTPPQKRSLLLPDVPYNSLRAFQNFVAFGGFQEQA
jgi:hypothetical protein